MPTSKKQMTKLNQVKKAKAEELSKQAAAGSKDARKKLEEAREKDQVSLPGFPPLFGFLLKVRPMPGGTGWNQRGV